MSPEPDSPRTHDRYRDDLAAYALGALKESETAELERHLASCVDCRTQMRWLRPAVDLLPRSVEQLEPPPRLRKRLLATVRAEARRATPRGAELRWSARRREWRAALWRPATALAATAFVVAGAAGGYLLHKPDGSTSVVAARPAAAAPAASGLLAREGHTAILHVAGMPALSKDEVYEVWVQRDGALRPSSLFVLRRDHSADAAVPGPLEDADSVLVTREPRGGSEQPTSSPLLRAPLD